MYVLFLQVCAENHNLSNELSQLRSSHKQLKEEKETMDTQLSTLQPAHAELQQMHDKVSIELQDTKISLQKSQEARVRAEVGTGVPAHELTRKRSWQSPAHQ